MPGRLFANSTAAVPATDTGTTITQGFSNDLGTYPEWLIYQTVTATPITQSNSYVYVSGPDELTQTFYVATAISNTTGGGGTPPAIGWPDVSFFGGLAGDSDATKIAIMNQACSHLASRAEAQGPNEDLGANLTAAGYPFASGGSADNFARQLNGDAGAGSAGTAGKKCPILVFVNGAIIS